MRAHPPAPRTHFVSIVIVLSLVTASCVDLGRTIDSSGRILGELVVTEPGGGVAAPLSVAGPARLRRLSERTLLVVARIVRPALGETRRGDLFLRITTDRDLDGTKPYRGGVGALEVAYIESARSSAGVHHGGSGQVRLDLVPQPGSPSLQVALELVLRPLGAANAGSLTLRALIASDGGVPIDAGLGFGLWLDDDFEPGDVLVDADYDFDDFAGSAADAWITTGEAEAPAGFGYFDFGDDGEVVAPGYDPGSGGDPGVVDPGVDPGDPGGGFDPGGGVDPGPDPGYDYGYDDDADGGCQGDKASQDSSQCGALRATPRGAGFLLVLATLAIARARRRRRRVVPASRDL